MNANIVVSYLNKIYKDNYTIFICNFGFVIKNNKEAIFEYTHDYYKEIKFLLKNYIKIIDESLKIETIKTNKIYINYTYKHKKLYCTNSNKRKYIQYNFRKTKICYINNNSIIYSIDIYKYNQLKYKFNNKRMKNNKIFFTNKYELLYASNYFLSI